jgi:hypothetical protein
MECTGRAFDPVEKESRRAGELISPLHIVAAVATISVRRNS